MYLSAVPVITSFPSLEVGLPYPSICLSPYRNPFSLNCPLLYFISEQSNPIALDGSTENAKSRLLQEKYETMLEYYFRIR